MQSMKIAIYNGQIVLENGILWDGVILIEDGKIISFGKRRELEIPWDFLQIDAKGAYVGPGFVDIHVHGGGGFSTCQDPEKAAQHFLRHGETTILGTPDYAMNLQTLLDSIHTIKSAMKTSPSIKGIYMEGPYTNPQYGCCSDINPWRCGVEKAAYKALVDACGEDVKVWTVDPEHPDLIPFLAYARTVNPDTVIAMGHSQATPMQVRSLGKYRPTLMTHTFNATGRHPVFSGTRGYGPDEYCLKESDMYTELISDSQGIHVHPEMQQLLLHCKGVDKVVLISDSTVFDNPTPPEYAHVEDLNFDHNGDIAGSKLTLDLACRNIMASTSCGITQAFRMASLNPAKVIGMEDSIGSIAVGKNADLVFVDDKFNVQQVVLEGNLCHFD